jgi:hypothetical protein
MWLGAVVGMVALYFACGLTWGMLQFGQFMLQRTIGTAGFWRPSSAFWSHLSVALFPVDVWPWNADLYDSSLSAHAFLGLIVLALTPLCFVCLPLTLRAAKVRRLHLVRMTAWSIIVPPLLLQAASSGLRLVASIESTFRYAQDSPLFQFAQQQGGRVFLGMLVLWLLAWWHCACRDYLKLPRALGVAGSMVAMAVLLGVLISIFVPGMAMALLT